MPITELAFPFFKQDEETLVELKRKAPEIWRSLPRIEGLQAAFHGLVVEDNGSTFDVESMRTVVVYRMSRD
jgi:hypothetical protein